MEEERVPRINQLSTEEVSLSTGTILRKVLKSISTLVTNQLIYAREVVQLLYTCICLCNVLINTTAVLKCKVTIFCKDWPWKANAVIKFYNEKFEWIHIVVFFIPEIITDVYLIFLCFRTPRIAVMPRRLSAIWARAVVTAASYTTWCTVWWSATLTAAPWSWNPRGGATLRLGGSLCFSPSVTPARPNLELAQSFGKVSFRERYFVGGKLYW